MGSPESESSIPTITPSSFIPEVIEAIKQSIQECEFNEVQKILKEREKNTRIEMDNLVRDQGLSAQLEKSKLEEKLQSSQKQCEELKNRVKGWIERDKRGKMLYDEACEEITKRGKTISELNEKINVLESEKSRNERLVGEYEEKLRCMEARVVKMDELKVLYDKASEENSVMAKTISELKEKNNVLENKYSGNERLVGEYEEKLRCMDDEMKILRNEKLAAERTVDELRAEKLESDGKFVTRIAKMEEALANLLSVRVENLDDKKGGRKENGANSVQTCSNLVQICRNGAQSGREAERNDNDEENRSKGGQGSGGRKENGTNTIQKCSNLARIRCNGAKYGREAERNGNDEENTSKGGQGSGPKVLGAPVKERLMSGAGYSRNIVPSSSPFACDIVEISDSDDEANPDGNEMTFGKNSSTQTNKKRNRTPPITSTLKRKRSLRDSDDNDDIILPNKGKEI